MFGARAMPARCMGRGVIENRLRAPPNGLPESVYLDHAGPTGLVRWMCAIADHAPAGGVLPSVLDLRHLLDAAARIEEGEPVPRTWKSSSPEVPRWVCSTESCSDGRCQRVDLQVPDRNDPFNVPAGRTAPRWNLRARRFGGAGTRLETLADAAVMLIERF